MNYLMTEELVNQQCGECQIHFAIPKAKERQCHNNLKARFYCPNGCKLMYLDSDAVKLKKELETKERALQTARNSRDTAWEYEAKAQRKAELSNQRLERVKNGVCPWCKRSFTNLKRHMQSKHTKKKKAPKKKVCPAAKAHKAKA